jgi:tetrapyrrole methylase family protein/MazG family protein
MTDRNIPTRIVDGISALDVIASAIGVDLLTQEVQILDALSLVSFLDSEPFAGGQLDFSPRRPCLVLQVYSQRMASSCKLALSRYFPDDHEVILITSAGTVDNLVIERCSLFEIDRHPVDHLTSLWIPALPSLEALRSFATLQHIVARLRAPGGCPWDRHQTHATLRDAVIEEAYEVVDEIDACDDEGLAEELGDLLLQVLMHAQIGEEDGTFSSEGVIEHISRKLIRRHPHVFGTVEADTPEAVLKTWESVKAEERKNKRASDEYERRHPLDRMPASMPVLTRVSRLLKIADSVPPNDDQRDEIAEGLFAAVRRAVEAGLDPERELDRAARPFFISKSSAE